MHRLQKYERPFKRLVMRQRNPGVSWAKGSIEDGKITKIVFWPNFLEFLLVSLSLCSKVSGLPCEI